jgi:BirA family biotin operon repressor/biotin-[acetyl-CoA-carboxylase] ligase
MTIKESVLEALEKNRDVSISGEVLAKNLNVSRSGIWKAIKSLKEEGYEIKATTNKGYQLEKDSDLISFEGIRPWLSENNKKIPIEAFKTIDSTNQLAKKMAMNGAEHGTVIVSEEQTKGRGRMGRDFFSPGNSGIYMSIIIKPNVYAYEAVSLTTATSVGVCRGIKKVTNKDVKIKWVNDIYYQNKKIAGILTEAVTDFETGFLECAIIGIGINFRVPENNFPEEIKAVAGALFNKKPDTLTRNQLVGEIINEVLAVTENLNNRDYIEEYKAHSMVLGHEIKVFKNNQSFVSKAVDIDLNGGLIIEDQSGKRETLNSGEISIRKMGNKI